eukprot:8921632-Pyramimonas_sp.AAC.1
MHVTPSSCPIHSGGQGQGIEGNLVWHDGILGAPREGLAELCYWGPCFRFPMHQLVLKEGPVREDSAKIYMAANHMRMRPSTQQ